MPKVLRKISVDEISSVPAGAGRGTRVILRKRDPGAVMNDALAALDTSIKSIIDDAGMVAKAAAVTDSVGQFVEYLERAGVDSDTAEARAAEIVGKYAVVKSAAQQQHEEVIEVGPETVVAKVDRAVSFGRSLQAAIDDYAREHNVSKSVACDRVILGGQVNTYVRTEKMLRTAADADYGQALASRNDAGIVVREATVSKGDGGTKYAEKLNAMADEFRQSEWGRGLTKEQCYDRACQTDKGKKLLAKLKAASRGEHVDDDGDDDVSKDYSATDHKGRAGNPKLSGDVLSVTDAAEIMQRMLAEKMKADPSTDAIQYVNQMARSPQWSPEVGRAAAAKVMEQARRAGGGYAPGFTPAAKRGAMDELQEIAKQLCAADPSLTPEMAFTKAYTDPKNRDLVRAEYQQRMAGKAA